MRHPLVILAALLGLSATAHGTPWRDAAQTLGDAAPDQETLHDYLAPALKGDADDLREADGERLARIAELKKEYDTSRAPITRAGDLYELSKLYQERSFYLRDQAVGDYLAALDKWWIGEALEMPKLHLDGAREKLLERVNVLRDMVATFPRDPRIDEITWQLAGTMARLGNDHAEFYFKQAIGPAKMGEWGMKARLSRADYLVATKHEGEAVALYTDVRKAAADELKAYATYRLGWVYLTKGLAATGKARNDLMAKAEAALKLVVVSVKEDGDTRFPLKAEAAHDLAWLWAVTGNEKEALAFFDRQDLAELVPVFRDKLAVAWIDQRQIAKAAAYYHGLIAKNPTDPRVPDMLLRLCQAYLMAGDVKSLGQETARLERLTTAKDDPWLDEHEGDEALLARTRRMVTQLPLTAGLKLARAADTEADPKHKRDMLTGTVKELQAYVSRSPKDPQVAAVRVTLVTALIGLERYPEALDQLDEIVKLGPKASAYLANAAYERLNILVKLDGDKKYPAVPGPGAVPHPLELPELKRRFAAAAAAYLALVPKADIEPNLRYAVAQDLFTYGHYQEALPLFEALVNDFPKSDQARAAVEILLSYHMKHDQFAEVVRLSTEFLNNRNVKGKSLRDYIKQNLDYANGRKSG